MNEILRDFIPRRPDGWALARIGDALAEVDRPIEMRDSTEYRLASIRRRNGGMFHRETLPGGDILTKTLREVVPGSFVLARMQVVHGACALVPDEFAGYAISKSYSSFVGTTECDIGFFAHLAKQPFMYRYFMDASHGVVIEKMTFDQDRWLSFPIYLPPLEEQRRIADILDTIDEAIRATERLIVKQDDVWKAVAQETLDRGLRAVSTSQLGEIADVYNGSTPSRGRRDFWTEGTIPWVASGKVNDGKIVEPTDLITKAAVRATGLRPTRAGAVLVGLIGQGRTRGMAAQLGITATINQNVAAVVPRDGLDDDYLLAQLRYRYGELRFGGRGSNQDALNCSLVKAFEIPFPPIEDQVRIAQTLTAESDLKDCDTQELAKLRSLRAGLTSDLLSGRVRTVAS